MYHIDDYQPFSYSNLQEDLGNKMSIGDTSKHLSEFQHTKFKYMFSAFFDIEEVKLLSIECYRCMSG